MAEFLDGLSPEAEKRIISYGKQVDDLIAKIGKASNAQIGGRTPSGTDSAIKDLNDQLRQQENIIKKLQIDYVRLAEVRRSGNIQEKVDGSIILQQQKQQAVIVSEVAGAYKRLSAQQAASSTNVQNIIARGRLATQTQREYNAELRKAQGEFNKLDAQVRKAEAAVGRFQRSVGNYPKLVNSITSLVGALGVTTGVAGIAALATSIYNTTKQTQSLDLALRQVVGTQEKFIESQSFLSRISDAYGQDIQSLTKQYTQFYVSAKDKLAGREIEQIFESVAKAAGTMGLSAESSERAFLALNQMLSKGTVQSEELKGQLGEALPGAFGILARSMGVTEKQLGVLLKNGEVLAAEVLPKFAKELEKAYGIEAVKKIETLAASQNRLKNNWVDLVRTMNENETGGITQFFAFFTNAANDAIRTLAELNKGVKALRNEAASDSKASLLSFYDQLPDDKARMETAKIDRQNALDWIATYNEQLRKANHEYELFNKVSVLNFSPDRVAMREEAAKNQERLNLALGVQRGRLQAANEILNLNNKAVKTNTELTKAQLKAIEDAKRDKYDTRLAELQLEQQVIDRTLESEEQFYTVRIGALDKHFNKRIEIISLMYAEEVRRAGKSQDKQKQALIKFHSESLKEIESYKSKRDQLESMELQPEGVVDTYDNEAELSKMIAKDTEERERNNEAIERGRQAWKDAQKAMQDYAYSFGESFFGENGLSTLFDILNEKILGFGVEAKVTILAFSEAFQEAFNAIDKASQENFDAEYKRLEQEKNIAIQFAGESDSAKENIEKQYERRRREIQRRELQAAKQIAKFNTIINTAQAVVSALATANNIYAGIALAAVAAAAGAVQLAAINAQQIPQYYKGTENAASGWAWTQEKGAEAIFDRTGKLKTLGHEKGATLTKMDGGEKVLNAEDTKALMFDNGLNNILNERGINPSHNTINKIDNTEVVTELRQLKSVIANKQSDVMVYDRLGVSLYEKRNGSTVKWNANRLRIKKNGI